MRWKGNHRNHIADFGQRIDQTELTILEDAFTKYLANIAVVSSQKNAAHGGVPKEVV